MALDSTTAGSNVRPIAVIADPTLASNILNVGQTHASDGQTLGGSLYSLLMGAVPLLFNGTTYDRQRSAAGTTGVAAVNTEGVKATYGTVSLGLTPATAATDIWMLTAPGAKKVRLTRISISGIASAAGVVDLQLVKRTAANSGGASTTPNIIQYDPNDGVASAVVTQYSANPTTGAGVPFRVAKLWLGTTSPGGIVTWDFTNRNSKAPILAAGGVQALVLNLNGGTIPSGAAINIDAEWTEE